MRVEFVGQSHGDELACEHKGTGTAQGGSIATQGYSTWATETWRRAKIIACYLNMDTSQYHRVLLPTSTAKACC